MISGMLPHAFYTRHQSHIFAVKGQGLCIWPKSVLFLDNKTDDMYMVL